MITLKNDKIQISVKEHGAELCSLRKGDREYLWQADEKYWKRHSPVLFPIVGSVWEKVFRSKGKEYTMGQHGFARDMDFTLLEKSENEVWYELKSDGSTLEKYPYAFSLRIGYRLEESSVRVLWKVSSDEEIYFQIGAHPAFHWPMLKDSEIEEGTASMEKALDGSKQRGWFLLEPQRKTMRSSCVSKMGCIGPEDAYDITTDNGYIPIATDSFDKDALIFEDGMVGKVTLCDQDRNPYLSLTFDAPLVGLWSPPGKNAPFVCIEPWYGRADEACYTGIYEQKPWIQHLSPGECFEGGYLIEII